MCNICYTRYVMKNTHTKALFYAGTLFLIILSVLAIAATIFVMKGNQSYENNTISVTGTAEVSSAPDIAKFSFSVKETSKDPKKGQEVINKKVSNILAGLEELGLKEKDLRTESYTIYPKYEWVKITDKQPKIALSGEKYIPHNNSKQVQVGFDVSQRVMVTLRDLKAVPEALSLFAENAVENLSGPNFDIDDVDGLKEEARLEAIAAAKKKAKRLASDLEVRLGKIVSFNENNHIPMPYQRNILMAKSVSLESADYAPELPAGENTISSTVTITYKIK